MIKLCRLIKRRKDMTKQEFRDWWLKDHAPEGKNLEGLKGYQICFTLDDEEFPYDGMAEMWFDSVEAANKAFDTDLGRSLAEDAIAHAEVRIGITVEENRLV